MFLIVVTTSFGAPVTGQTLTYKRSTTTYSTTEFVVPTTTTGGPPITSITPFLSTVQSKLTFSEENIMEINLEA